MQCLATSDDLVTWEKYTGNPVIPASQKPEGFGDTFRDPQAWREDDAWYCIIGGNQPEGDDQLANGASFLYRSRDLIDWQYLHPLYVGPAARDECPDFFPLDGPRGRKWALLSSRRETAWAVGDYRDHRFTPEHTGTVDDTLYYAAKTAADDKGRRVLFSWVREGRSREAYSAAGWSGAFALPRVLSILPDGTLGQEPVPELEALRGKQIARIGCHTVRGRETSRASTCRAATVSSSSPGSTPATPTASAWPCRAATRFSTTDRRRPSPAAPRAGSRRAADRPRLCRSLRDRGLRARPVCKTIRTYHQPGDALDQIRLIARGGTATLESLDVWQMGSIQGEHVG